MAQQVKSACQKSPAEFFPRTHSGKRTNSWKLPSDLCMCAMACVFLIFMHTIIIRVFLIIKSKNTVTLLGNSVSSFEFPAVMFSLPLSPPSGIDMSAILLKLGFKESLIQSKMAAGTSTFVVAYAIHKLFAPVRISVTLFSVPLVVRYFRRVGLFKPPATKP